MNEQIEQTVKKNGMKKILFRILVYMWLLFLIAFAIVRGFHYGVFPKSWFYYVFFGAVVTDLVSKVLYDVKKEGTSLKLKKVSRILYLLSIWTTFIQRIVYTIIEYILYM